MNRLGRGAAPIVILGLILLGSTYLMSNATQDSARFGELYSVLLAINAVALIGLGVLIAWNLYHLLHQAREQRPGAKLTVSNGHRVRRPVGDSGHHRLLLLAPVPAPRNRQLVRRAHRRGA